MTARSGNGLTVMHIALHLTAGTRKIFHPAFLLALPLAACAQPAPVPSPQDPLNRDSPQSSVHSFLEASHARNYGRASKYLDLRKLPEDQRRKDGPRLAEELAQILDRDAEFEVAALSRQPGGDRQDELPPNRERIESFEAGDQKLELELEHVTLRSGLPVWLFSSDSLALIPRLAQLTSDSPVEKHLPRPLVRWTLLDTSIWRWIALTLLAVGLIVFSRLVSLLALWLVEAIAKRIAPKVDRTSFSAFLGPLRLLASVALFRAGMAWIGPSASLRMHLDRCLVLLFFLGLAWFGAGVVDLILSRIRVALVSKHHTFSHSVLPLFSRVLKVAILLLTVAAVLGEWGYNATTILAGLGVGGVAIALAAQKTIENLFGGVSVVSDRPVSVGDYCKFGDRAGTVEDIGLRSTRIRTADRTLVTVPNAQFSTMTLENFSKRDKMLFHLTLNLRRDTTSDQVRTLLGSLTKILAEHPKVEEGTLPVRFIGVGTYSLDLEIFAYVLTRDDDAFLKTQQDLLLSVLNAVEAAGTALALPVSHLALDNLSPHVRSKFLEDVESSVAR